MPEPIAALAGPCRPSQGNSATIVTTTLNAKAEAF